MNGFCVPAEDRTPDPLIKSQLLYQLSYRNSKIGRQIYKTTAEIIINANNYS
jgi:hypothetical protein